MQGKGRGDHCCLPRPEGSWPNLAVLALSPKNPCFAVCWPCRPIGLAYAIQRATTIYISHQRQIAGSAARELGRHSLRTPVSTGLNSGESVRRINLGLGVSNANRNHYLLLSISPLACVYPTHSLRRTANTGLLASRWPTKCYLVR